ncbi:MAG: tetratricopeptide repeat protein, partial [Acidobacteriota bacterium]
MSMWDRCVAVLVCLLAPAAVGGGPAAQDGMTTRGLMREAAGARLEGRLEQAASLYSRVIDLEPGNRLALYNAAIILEKLGRRDLAVGVWSKALKADAGDLFAYEHLLRNLHRDDLETLIAQETLRVKADRDSTLKRLHLALDEMAAGRGSAAVKPLEEVLLIRPSSNIAYLFLKDA